MKDNKKKSKLYEFDTTADAKGTRGYTAFLKDSDVPKQRAQLRNSIKKTTGYTMLKEELKKLIKKELVSVLNEATEYRGTKEARNYFKSNPVKGWKIRYDFRNPVWLEFVNPKEDIATFSVKKGVWMLYLDSDRETMKTLGELMSHKEGTWKTKEDIEKILSKLK